jgi:MoaA/NifB/PqqE/SkfB family radical SAM enzyme
LSAILDSAKLAFQQRSHRIQFVPIVIVYLNYVCDSRCKSCSIWKNNELLKVADHRQMSDTLLRELYPRVREWRPRQILLSGGEPALHPRFSTAIESFASIAHVAVITNGLTLDTWEPASLSKASEYYISFDAPDRETYLRIRGVDGFDRLAVNVAKLRRLDPLPRIIARCTLQRDNVRRIAELIRAARELRFDAISFLGADISSEAFARDTHGLSDAAAVAPSREDLDAMENTIQSLDADDNFVEGGAEKLARIVQYFRALSGADVFPEVRCNAPWVSVVVETSGKVRGCFFQPVIGDYHHINSETAVRFRQSLNVASDRTCRRCVCSKLLSARELVRMYAH